MVETQELLRRIAALRQRLGQTPGIPKDAGSAATALLEKGSAAAPLKAKVEAGARQQSLLGTALRQLSGHAGYAAPGAPMPAQLTSRATRLLRRAHDLLTQLRALGDNSQITDTDSGPLHQLHHETVSMTDAVARTVQAFPDAPSAQIRLCEGLEAVLNVVADRLSVITLTVQQRRREATRCNVLVEFLAALASGHTVESKGLMSIAESILEDAREGRPLQFPEIGSSNVVRHIAAHSLAVAQIAARLARDDEQWRGKALEPIMAALVHDAGMVKMPSVLLGHGTPLNDEQRRMIETHPILGADMATRITPGLPWLAEAAGQHHERLDGAGYPAGLRDTQLKPLIRLLSVCDVYAAMCQPRAHRPALDTRTALTDTLLMAEKGELDQHQAERLLALSFYPVGSVVELSDGSVGAVVATHQGRRELSGPARPVVALLTDEQGQLLPGPRHVDLSEVEGRTILRGMPSAERRERLGKRYPELAA